LTNIYLHIILLTILICLILFKMSSNDGNLESNRHFLDTLANGLRIIIDSDELNDSDISDSVYSTIRRAYEENKDSLPYSVYEVGTKLVEHALSLSLAEDENYRMLFRRLFRYPNILAKTLCKMDPNRFFDLFTVRWGVHSFLSDYIALDDDSLPFNEAEEGGFDPYLSVEAISPSQSILDAIVNHIDHLDEDDIFEMAIPLFKQSADGDQDGFNKGYNELLTLLDRDNIKNDPKKIAVIQKVYDRFETLINMEFGEFKPYLRNKNFPYITVRMAIKSMEEDQKKGVNRRFAHFDTRTGKTSLGLLEPEYLGKKRVLYICPPDTIRTILNEYTLYGGNPSEIFVVRSSADMIAFSENPNGYKYCIIPNSLMINRDSNLEMNQTDSALESRMNSIDDLAEYTNQSLIELVKEWSPDHVVVDEARHFTGYYSNTLDSNDEESPNTRLFKSGSKRSKALLYILNHPDLLDSDASVRLMDATPGDLPRHFFPLISILNHKEFPMPENVYSVFGHQAYFLSSYMSDRTDYAAHFQVYDRPPSVNLRDTVEMGAAQDLLYEHASSYSTPNALHRITLARLATFNPVLLRRSFKKLLKVPMQESEFKKRFIAVCNEWKARKTDQNDLLFDWDFLAQYADRDLFIHLFTFGANAFSSCFSDFESDFQGLLDQIQSSDHNLSSKFQQVIHRLTELSENQELEESSRRVVIFSSFKYGFTRDFRGDDLKEEDSISFSEIGSSLSAYIQEQMPGVKVFILDGFVSTKNKSDSLSSRDLVRRAWSNYKGFSVLIAVGSATSQGIDLTSPGNSIEEIHLDLPLDSRAYYQLKSRTLGPSQDSLVTKRVLFAISDGENTIDKGVFDLLTFKSGLGGMITGADKIPSSVIEAAGEVDRVFLGKYVEASDSEEGVVSGTRDSLDESLSK